MRPLRILIRLHTRHRQVELTMEMVAEFYLEKKQLRRGVSSFKIPHLWTDMKNCDQQISTAY